MVSVLAFFSNDPSSNPAEAYSFFYKICVWKNEEKQATWTNYSRRINSKMGFMYAGIGTSLVPTYLSSRRNTKFVRSDDSYFSSCEFFGFFPRAQSIVVGRCKQLNYISPSLKLKIQKAFSIPQDTHFEKSLANALVFNWFM